MFPSGAMTRRLKMQNMTNDIRSKISNYKKSGIAIDDLIQGINIQGENLSGCIINKFDYSNQDISNCNLSNTKIINANLMYAIANNVNFSYADLSGSNCKKMSAVGANFMRANCKDTDFCLADLRGCNFCDVTWTFSARYLYKTKVSINLHELLDRIWSPINDGTISQFSEPR